VENIVDCEYLLNCAIFKRFRTEGSKSIWISFYCKGAKQEKCARKIMKKTGKEPPITLLPSGKHFSDLDRK